MNNYQILYSPYKTPEYWDNIPRGELNVFAYI